MTAVAAGIVIVVDDDDRGCEFESISVSKTEDLASFATGHSSCNFSAVQKPWYARKKFIYPDLFFLCACAGSKMKSELSS